ncbi:rCG52461 [Rattus norvegicus]|uniref:RCG52461 n=1 Tax=Rattus norvegicus TaxID=10116 RepID=A6K0X7_RAT|nr:rCG52461 [Rattus norvegicus]
MCSHYCHHKRRGTGAQLLHLCACLCCEAVSCSACSPCIWFVPKNNLECLILLPPAPQCWGDRFMS